MRIGYPCVNTTAGCTSSRTFRLKSYSEKRLIETLNSNLSCLYKILTFNIKHNILFFRITSDIVPFASHPICKFNWQRHFIDAFQAIGDLVKKHCVRISMHPDQFIVLNSLNRTVFENSVRELVYHAQVLDLMGLDASAKIQIHVGGVYKDKDISLGRFVERFERLDDTVKRRLVVENDERSYTLKDCLYISSETGIPILFDAFHHEVNSSGETVPEAFGLFTKTWKERDGLPMVDYSSQKEFQRTGKHVEKINSKHFTDFLEMTRPYDFDVMLEIKDKEKSALKAVEIASRDGRFKVAP
jgi:UV DNA damage endonuclease